MKKKVLVRAEDFKAVTGKVACTPTPAKRPRWYIISVLDDMFIVECANKDTFLVNQVYVKEEDII